MCACVCGGQVFLEIRIGLLARHVQLTHTQSGCDEEILSMEAKLTPQESLIYRCEQQLRDREGSSLYPLHLLL